MKRYWKIIDSYILKKFLSTFFFAIMILAVISCVIDYSQKIDDLVKNNAPIGAVAFYFLNFIPHIVALLFPLFIFIATIFFTSKMAYRTEIIATLSAGVSFRRFLRPYWVGSIFLALVALLSNHIIVPLANQNINTFHVNYIWNKKVASSENLHLRLSPNLYIYMERYNYDENSGKRFTAEHIEGVLLKEKVMALSASYDSIKSEWQLKNVTIRRNEGTKEILEKHEELNIKYPFTPKDLDDDDRVKEIMTTPELIRYTQRERERGRESVNYFLIELYKRTSQPIAGIILTIIGVCIASVKVRGGSGFHLVIGIIISALYMLFLQFAQTFSTNAGLSPLLAMWIPNFVFMLLAMILYLRQVK